MDENLTKLTEILKGQGLSESAIKQALELISSRDSKSVAENKSTTPISIIDSSTRKKVNDAIVSSLTDNKGPVSFRTLRLPNGKEMYQPINGKTDTRSNYDLNKLDTKAAAIGKTRAEYESMSPLDRYKLENASAVAETDRRQQIKDSNAIPVSKNISSGLKGGQVFQDENGKLESPSDLKSRLISEGKSETDATIAAGQRYRDMFAPPGDRGSAQSEAYKNAAPDNRSKVLQGLRDARAENLRTLTDARLANPNRKEVGVVTKMETPDGYVLAQRGESEDGKTATSGIAGATGSMNDTYGALKYNGGNNIKEALNSYNNQDAVGKPNVPVYYEGTNTPSMTLQDPKKQEMAVAPPPTVTKTDGGATVVKGIYGTAIGKPKTDTTTNTIAMDKSPSVPPGFQKNPDGKVVATRPDPVKEQLIENISKTLGLPESQKYTATKLAEEELKKRVTLTKSDVGLVTATKLAEEELKKRDANKKRGI